MKCRGEWVGSRLTWWGLRYTADVAHWPLGVRWLPFVYVHCGAVSIFRLLGFRRVGAGRSRAVSVFWVTMKRWEVAG